MNLLAITNNITEYKLPRFSRLKNISPLSDKEHDIAVSGHAEIKSVLYISSVAPST